ncbi:MAG: aldo/keto reductase [Christensenellaceae bacterium]|jgi:predicted aldo/keto reductase-like oxidoreductase|nr:aldo/keto reductase [Christensenellaceae bacterium]
MQYREIGKTGHKISALGFGAMRLPSFEKGEKRVFDEDLSIAMMHRAMELGVNYFDTAPGYCDTISEIIVGKALKGRRKDVYLSTKNPIENASGDDYEKRLEKSLRQLDTDYIDFYHFWGISLDAWTTKVDTPDGPLARAIKLKEQGVLKNISFSFHDRAENMIEIIKRSGGVFSSVLCQYNLLDRSNADAIAYAHEQGLGVVIMGPVGGGRLGAPTEAIAKMLPNGSSSSADVALRFVLNHPGVTCALSGMSTMAQVEENAKVLSNATALTASEEAQIAAALEENKRLADLYCTGCNYCMPCPKGINIPEVFRMMNAHRVYGLTEYARREYSNIGKNPRFGLADASGCVDCGMCEKKCPQHLKIREQLKQSHEVLG